MGRLGDFITSLDIFGHPIGINYRGEGTFKTLLGSFCTVLITVLMTINTVTLTTAYRDNSKLERSTQQTTYVPFDESAFNFTDYQTEINISFVGNYPPKDIGMFNLYQNKGCLFAEITYNITACKESGRIV